MRHGPWEEYQALLDAAWFGRMPCDLRGKSPVAIERKNRRTARFLYDLPDDGREPIPIAVNLPEYFSQG